MIKNFFHSLSGAASSTPTQSQTPGSTPTSAVTPATLTDTTSTDQRVSDEQTPTQPAIASYSAQQRAVSDTVTPYVDLNEEQRDGQRPSSTETTSLAEATQPSPEPPRQPVTPTTATTTNRNEPRHSPTPQQADPALMRYLERLEHDLDRAEAENDNKNEIIHSLIERNRETNILIQGLHKLVEIGVSTPALPRRDGEDGLPKAGK